MWCGCTVVVMRSPRLGRHGGGASGRVWAATDTVFASITPATRSVLARASWLPPFHRCTPSPGRALTPRVPSLQSAASLRRQGETDQATEDDDQDPAGNWYPSREPCCGGVLSTFHFCTSRTVMNSKITMLIPATAISAILIQNKGGLTHRPCTGSKVRVARLVWPLGDYNSLSAKLRATSG